MASGDRYGHYPQPQYGGGYNPGDYVPLAGPARPDEKKQQAPQAQPHRYNTVPNPQEFIPLPQSPGGRYNTSPYPLSPLVTPSGPPPPYYGNSSNPASLYSSPISAHDTLSNQLAGLTMQDGYPRPAEQYPPDSQKPHPYQQRPPMPGQQYTQPYIAPPHQASAQFPSHATPQYERPYQQPPPADSKQAYGLYPPQSPGRPSSAPPGKYDDWQSAFPGASPPVSPVAGPSGYYKDDLVDDRQSRVVNRFVGNMLPVRIGRAGFQSIVSTAKLSHYLSPWGDNTPIVLPNVRKRDVAMSGLSHVTWGALSPGALSVVGKSVENAIKFATEHVVEKGVHHVVASDKSHRVKREVGITSLKLVMHHKLVGEDAHISLLGEKAAVDKRSCAKGWLCPYLYASGRNPRISRSTDFEIAQLVGPGLASDAAIAPALLSALPETSTPIASLCPWESPHPMMPRFRRMGIFLLGISPHRKSWSQSRIPNEARFTCHLFTHVPAVVIPVKEASPVLAWSPWTLELMSLRQQAEAIRDGKKFKSSKVDMDLAYGELPHAKSLGNLLVYDQRTHMGELLNYLHSVVDINLIDPSLQGHWRVVLREAIESLIYEAIRTHEVLGHDLGGICDIERAGVAMFRY